MPTRKKMVSNGTAATSGGEARLKEKTSSVDEQVRTIVKKPDLVDKVVQRSGLKKKDAKLAIEATLASIAELLESGHDLSAHPLGKIRVVKSKTIDDGATVFTAKIRTAKRVKPDV